MSFSHVAGQSKVGSGDSSATVALAFTSAVLLGSLIVVCGQKSDSGGNVPFTAGNLTKTAGTSTISTPTLDNTGNFDLGTSQFNNNAIWSAIVTTAGTLTLTIGGMGGASFSFMAIDEFSSTGGVDATRVEQAPSPNQSATDNPPTGACNNGTSAGAAVFIGSLGSDASGDITSLTANNGTAIGSVILGGSHLIGAASYNVQAAGTTIAPAWTFTNGASTVFGFNAIQVVYREIVSAVTTTLMGKRLIIGP